MNDEFIAYHLITKNPDVIQELESAVRPITMILEFKQNAIIQVQTRTKCNHGFQTGAGPSSCTQAGIQESPPDPDTILGRCRPAGSLTLSLSSIMFLDAVNDPSSGVALNL
jgi:hypothetical protein